MAIIDTTRTFAPRDITTGFSLGALLSRMAETLQRWADARATHRSLSALTDRELADIGLIRADIETIVTHGRLL